MTTRAEKLLLSLENGGHAGPAPQLDLWSQAPLDKEENDIPESHKQLLEDLKSFSIQRMTPLDALNKIAEWQQELS